MFQKFLFAFLFASIATTQLAFSESLVKPSHKPGKAFPHAKITVKNLDRSPLYFVRNDGQFDSRVKYYAQDGSTTLYFTIEAIYLSFNNVDPEENTEHSFSLLKKNLRSAPKKQAVVIQEVIRLVPTGASKKTQLQGEGLTRAKFNYFLGNQKKWRSEVPAFHAVVYKNIYPGIDLKFYGNHSGKFEYDVIANPGSEPAKVMLAYEGIENLKVNGSGDLVIQLRKETLIQHKPSVYQLNGNKRQNINGRLATAERDGRFLVGFQLGKYDKKLALVIDPVISYSSYLGGSLHDFGHSVSLDSLNSAYIVGTSWSFNFPTTPGAFKTSTTDGIEGFVSKFSPDGSSLIYSTYIGGSSVDNCYSGAVDSNGSVYMACYTTSADFPLVNPFQASLNGGGDGAVAKLAPDGSSLIYSTYLGGSLPDDYPYAVAIDGNNNAYVAGETKSADFPLQNPFQSAYAGGNYDAFITELNPSGNNLVYSSYLGGSGWDTIFGIAVDSLGSAYVTGENNSANFPTTPGAFDTVCDNGASCHDAFVSRIASGGTNLVYSTFLGGSDIDRGFAIAIDSDGSAYTTGKTLSELDFPVQNPIQPISGGGIDAYITKLSPDGSSLVFSTYLGGSDQDLGNTIAVDSSGAAYIAGVEYSPDFPVVNPLAVDCGLDAFITRVTPQGDAWYYSTCLGGSFYDEALGIAVDNNGMVYVTGYTLSTDFPIRNAAQSNNAGEYDAFITKLICDSIDSPSVLENEGVARFTVRLCSPRASDVAINYITSDGTAIAGSDYVFTSGQLTIIAGDTTGVIDVPLIDDTNSESNENFFLNLTSADIDFGISQVEVMILDNDGLLFDDFEDGIMNWDVTKGQWVENGGFLIGTPTQNSALAFAPVPWFPSGVSGCSNCTIETEMQTAGGSFNKIMLQAWYENNGNKVELIMKEEANKWVLKQRSAGFVVAKAKAVSPIDPNTNYNVLLSFDGISFHLTVNGASILSMEAAAAPFGKVGFKAKKTSGTFGQIRVY